MLKSFFVFVFIFVFVTSSHAASKETLKYADCEGKALYLDHYSNGDTVFSRGCVIFVFGGGFAAGSRDEKYYTPYFDWLCENGYDVVSIDYRLAMSHEYDSYGWKSGVSGRIKRFKSAIQWAADDLITATSFVLKHAREWHIDVTKIVACGSSAGAIACLQAENILCGKELIAELPEHFNYAAIVSFAGAIFSTNGRPCWYKRPCPIMMFHGNSDRRVPYQKASLFGIGLWGSAYITQQLKDMDCSYYFYDATYQTHSMASKPMNDNRKEILDFLNQAVNNLNKIQIHNTVADPSLPKRKTKFSPFIYLSQKG